MRKLLMAVTIFTAALTSCDVAQNYVYKVQNLAAEEIEIRLEAFMVDTVITVPPGNEKTVLLKTHYSTITEKTEHSVDIDLIRCDVSMGGVMSSKDYLQDGSWAYDKKSGVYLAVITDEEFE